MKCEHKKIRRIHTHGKKSRPYKYCKDCGEIISNAELRKMRGRNIKGYRR